MSARAWLAVLFVPLAFACGRSETSALVAASQARNTQATQDASPFVARTDSTDASVADDASVANLASDAGAAAGRLCFQPHAGRFARCRKETSVSEASFSACLKAHESDPKTPDRFRVDRGAWMAFSPKHWRCVPLPADGAVRAEVESLGSAEVRLAADCKSRTIDVSEASYGGAIALQCSRRNGKADELVESAP